MIFFRLLLETVIRLEYLLKARRSTFRNFVLTSYRPEKEHIADLRQKASQRRLIPIEKRILASVVDYLRRDGITQRALLQNRSWDLDGRNFRTLLKDTGSQEWGYSYGFGIGSHFVHGDWRDLTMHHLKGRGGRYFSQPRVQRRQTHDLLAQSQPSAFAFSRSSCGGTDPIATTLYERWRNSSMGSTED